MKRRIIASVFHSQVSAVMIVWVSLALLGLEFFTDRLHGLKPQRIGLESPTYYKTSVFDLTNTAAMELRQIATAMELRPDARVTAMVHDHKSNLLLLLHRASMGYTNS